MLTREAFIRLSLETNLFFQRIMKEHLFLIETYLQPVEAENIGKANSLKRNFEELLAESVNYASRAAVSEEAIRSNEFVTPYTMRAEEVTSRLTGASLDTRITREQINLFRDANYTYGERLNNDIWDLNNRSLNLLEETITFQNNLLAQVSQCQIFITLYDEMLEHDTREAEYYRDMLISLQNRRTPRRTLCRKLNFWNNIMGEHAQFIDGMLDPTEKTLKETAETFAERFEILVERCIRTAERQMLQRSIEATGRIRDFKRTATEGLLACEIKSIIPPLLADHVFREANHYLRILRM